MGSGLAGNVVNRLCGGYGTRVNPRPLPVRSGGGHPGSGGGSGSGDGGHPPPAQEEPWEQWADIVDGRVKLTQGVWASG